MYLLGKRISLRVIMLIQHLKLFPWKTGADLPPRGGGGGALVLDHLARGDPFLANTVFERGNGRGNFFALDMTKPPVGEAYVFVYVWNFRGCGDRI